MIQVEAEDASLKVYFNIAVSEVGLLKGTGYYIKQGVLLRQYRPKHVKADDEWAIVQQVIVPHKFREIIIDLAHNKFAGHLGVNKTSEKILQHFYWPDLRNTLLNLSNSVMHVKWVVNQTKRFQKHPYRLYL